jgi:hypothetical protein
MFSRFFHILTEGETLMEKASVTKETSTEQYIDGYDFQVEVDLMQYGDSVIITDNEDFLVWDCEDDVIVISFVKRGLSIRLTYSEWQQLRFLLTTEENPEDFDRVRGIQINPQGRNEFTIYFPLNRLNLLFRRHEFARFKLMVLSMGSPYPWGGKPQAATANN